MIPSLRRAAWIVGWVWFGLVIVLTVALVALRVAGGQVDLVESASMAPSIPREAVAVTLSAEAEDIKVDDVITFRNGEERLVLHRVTEILETGEIRRFRTKGDANQSSDPLLIHQRGVERRLWFSVDGLGPVARGLQPPLGLVWLVAVPALLLAVGVTGKSGRPEDAADSGDGDAKPAAGRSPNAKPAGPLAEV